MTCSACALIGYIFSGTSSMSQPAPFCFFAMAAIAIIARLRSVAWINIPVL